MAASPDFAAAVRFAQDLIRIPSLPGEEGDLAARVRMEMQQLGFDDVWIDDTGNVIGRVRGTAREPAVMLSSHLDAVDVGEESAWEYPPFGADVADGFLHGRGAMDIKGPLALQTHAAATFLQKRPAADVYVAHTVLEERGGLGMKRLLERGELKPSAVVLGEATNGDICVGHRGRAELIVEIHGVAAHASAPERARNPISMLTAVLPTLEQFARELGEDPVLGRATLAPTGIDTPHRSRNVIPDRVRLVLDWRVLPDTNERRAQELLADVLRAAVPDDSPYRVTVRFATERQVTYTGLVHERSMFTPGYLLSAEHPIVRAASVAIQVGTGRRPAIRTWTFATDGGHSCGTHDIPTIGFAPGDEKYAHTNRERLDLRDAEIAFNAYPAVIAGVQTAMRTD
jgi:putative selenium metabolism hydrolase